LGFFLQLVTNVLRIWLVKNKIEKLIKNNKIMGLDVSVYKNIKRTEVEDEIDFTAYVIDESWKYKIKNLEDGKHYKGEITDADVRYSYSTHNRFRETLLKIIERSDLLLKNGRIDWVRLENEKKIPFYELINFADNEGCLDFEISTILYNDFLKYKEVAVKYLANDDYTLQKYFDWLNVFENGKEANSVVVFC
jgi:hypothetical protein